MEIQNKKMQKKTHSEKINFSSNNIDMEMDPMKNKNFDIAYCKKLWELDCEKYNIIDDLKKEYISNFIKNHEFESKKYIETHLFKCGSSLVYFENDCVKMYNKRNFPLFFFYRMIDKKLRIYFEKETLPYYLVNDINSNFEIDHEKREINVIIKKNSQKTIINHFKRHSLL